MHMVWHDASCMQLIAVIAKKLQGVRDDLCDCVILQATGAVSCVQERVYFFRVEPVQLPFLIACQIPRRLFQGVFHCVALPDDAVDCLLRERVGETKGYRIDAAFRLPMREISALPDPHAVEWHS